MMSQMKKANVNTPVWESECTGTINLEDIILELLKIQLKEDIEARENNIRKVA